MAVRVTFDTNPFVASHGTHPRGRGSWAFGTVRNPDVCNDDQCWFSPGGMTFAEAKKWAKREVARRFGPDADGTLFVQP